MKKLTCTAENIKEFNATLRTELPEAHELAKELHKAGLLDGLRGATIEFLDNQPVTVEPVIIQRHCQDCKKWQRDTVGDGQGIGKCLIDYRPKQLKWSMQEACFNFEEIE